MPATTTSMARVCRTCSPPRRRCTLYLIVIGIAAIVALVISLLIVYRNHIYIPTPGSPSALREDGKKVFQAPIRPMQKSRGSQSDRNNSNKTTNELPTKELRRGGKNILHAPAHPVQTSRRCQNSEHGQTTNYPKDAKMQDSITKIQDRMDFLESLYLVRHEDIIDLQDSADVNRTNPHGTLLLKTNKQNSILKPEIIAMLRNLSGMRAAMGVHTSTSSVMQNSFVYKLLSHLMNDPAALRPAYHMTGGRKLADVVIGIPTVKRDKESYLMVTLTHLIQGLTSKDINNTLIVVYVGETDLEYVLYTAKQIETMFPKQVESGLIEVISPSPSYYPDLDKIPTTLGDSQKRVKWRTKQNLDAIYLMAYAQSKGTFYLMLEDDVIAKENYMQEIKQFTALSSISTPNWYILEFCHVGGIGKLFKSSELSNFIVYVQLFYTNMPIDWLMESYLADRVCALDKGSDPQFNLLPIYYPHNNPPIKYIRTSIKEHSDHTLKKAYEGQTFFWGVKPKERDTIEFWFAKPTVVKSYTFRSGNVKHTSDKFYDTAVEVYPESTRNFTVVDYFDEFGLADGTLKQNLGPLLAVRLRVNKDSFYGVILSEIEIKTNETENTTSQAKPNPPVKKARQQDRPRRIPYKKLRIRRQIGV